jgi:SP family general alpha glucoside:H+ symporter-like MFS transporter
MAQAQGKAESEMIENTTTAAAEDISPPDIKGGTPLMRSKEDNIGVWQSVRRYKRVGLIAMAAAFCASLDGYRKASLYFAQITSFVHP